MAAPKNVDVKHRGQTVRKWLPEGVQSTPY